MDAPSQYYLSLFKYLLQLKLSSSPSTQAYTFNEKVFSTEVSIFPSISSNKPNFILKEQKMEKIDYYREKVLKMKKMKVERQESKKKVIEKRMEEKNKKFISSFFGESNMIDKVIEGRGRGHKSAHQKNDGSCLMELNVSELKHRSNKSMHKRAVSNCFGETMKDEETKTKNDKQFPHNYLVDNNIIKINQIKGEFLSNNAKHEEMDKRNRNKAINISNTIQEIIEEENGTYEKRQEKNKINNFLVKHKLVKQEEKNVERKIAVKNKDMVK